MYQFTLCATCEKEVLLKDGIAWDFDFEQRGKEKHKCSKKVEYPENGINLLGNA